MLFCFFSAQYLPTVGGVERYTQNLAHRAVAAGHRALVVTSALPGLPERETDPEGVEILRLPAHLWMAGRFPAPRLGRAFRQAAAQIWEQKPDFCLIQTRFYPLSLYAAAACRRQGVSAIVVDHSTGHMPLDSAPARWAGQLYEHLACRFIRRRVPRFYGVSRAVCGWLGHFGVQAAGTLYNAVEPAALRTEAEAAPPQDWRAACGLAPGSRVVAFVGRVIPEKGVGLLAHAFVRAAVPNAALLVAGDGPALEALRAEALPGVHWLGAVPHPQVLQLLQQADLYCLPTRYAEGFPTTLLEAAVCGCPIVTSETGGSGELLPDDSFGRQLPQSELDEEHLAEALGAALADEDWRARASQKTRARVEQEFTWQAVWQALAAIAGAQ